MRRYRKFVWAIPVTSLVLMLSACGGGGDDKSSDPDKPFRGTRLNVEAIAGVPEFAFYARVTVAAPTRFKLALAAGYGAGTVAIDRATPEATRAALREVAPDGFDVVVDATGAVEVLALCVPLTAIGGTVLAYGVTAEDARLPISPYDVFRREITIKGSFSQAYSFDRALRALRSGRLDPAGIITHRFGLDDYGAALAAVRSDRSCLKAVLRP